MENPNLISLETANKMLPLVKPITEEMKKAWKQAVSSTKELEKLCQSDEEKPEQMASIAVDLQRATKVVSKNLDELEGLGCIVESFEGVIDFPSEIEGEEVMLCWKLGEEEVSHHHKRGETIRHRLLINQVLE